MSQILEYKNPTIPGFAPDPSVALVDDTFYLVNSTFHVFPGLPIYASKDLRSWTQIGNAIHRPEQLNLDNASSAAVPIGPGVILVATQRLFAPTIRYHNGTFYIICTNSSVEFPNLIMKNFYVTTKDIWSGEWSDPIWFDFHGIDPSLFFDDDGRVYIQGSWREGNLMNTECSIRQFEVDIATGKPLSETKLLWDGFAEKDGYYYLTAAESGTFEHHMITAARSKDIWGPYESCGNNPVLTAFGTKEYIQNTGHGDIFQGPYGDWWAVCLGIRNEDGRYPLGRETFLTPVSWPRDGWPEIEHPRMSFPRNSVTSSPPDNQAFKPSSRLPVDFLHIRNPRTENYIFSSTTSEITLIPQKTTLSTPTGATTFVASASVSWTAPQQPL